MPMIPKHPTIEDAILLATRLHAGQTDKAGKPYILHPLRVMQSPQITTEAEQLIGLFHDLLEDCKITGQQLRSLGYSETVVSGVAYLTKKADDDYDDYITGLVESGRADILHVKLADLDDNSNIARLPNPTPTDYKRREKYVRAIIRIQMALDRLPNQS